MFPGRRRDPPVGSSSRRTWHRSACPVIPSVCPLRNPLRTAAIVATPAVPLQPPSVRNSAICGVVRETNTLQMRLFRGSVCKTCNACRKLSTGTIRNVPAYRGRVLAFSPAGTRKTSAPERRTPTVFCLMPPTGATVPSSWISPSRRPDSRDRRPYRAAGRPRARTAARPRRRRRRPGRCSPCGGADPGVLRDLDADDRALRRRPAPDGAGRCARSSCRSAAPQRDFSPGESVPIAATRPPGVNTGRPAASTMTSPPCSVFAAGT